LRTGAGGFQANTGHALAHIHQHGHRGHGRFGLYDGDSNYCTPYWLKVDPSLCLY
jgi:hypothetical protein